jgi:16S rRNA (guanine(966)-N(2))-methyltransferase RsmD
MQVSGGANKGTRLVYPARGLRPTKDLVKKAILNSLRASIPGSRIADLYCGAGALGIEALSAGAASVVFVEQDRRIVRFLKANLKPWPGRARIIAGDVLRVIPRLSGSDFDIVIADPPYERGLDRATLDAIARFNLLVAGGLVVLEHSRRDNAVAPIELRLMRNYRFGDTVVSVFQRMDAY